MKMNKQLFVTLLLFVLLSSISCGRSEEEKAAVTNLNQASTQYNTYLETSPRDLDYIESMFDFKQDIQNTSDQISNSEEFNEALRDSIVNEYESIYDSIDSVLVSELSSISNIKISEASDLIDKIDFDSIYDLAEDYLGFSIDTAEPSSWRLRNVDTDNTALLADSIENLGSEMNALRDTLDLIYNLCEEVSIQADSIASSENRIVTLSDSLHSISGTLRSLVDDAKYEIDLHRFNHLSSRVRIKDDPAINREFHYHINSPYYVNSRNHICYLSVSKDQTGYGFLWFTVGYTRSNWVFLDQIDFNIDGRIVNLPFDEYDDVDDNISGGNVSEWVNLRADEELIADIINAEEVYVNFRGRNERYSRQLTQSDITALSEMLEYYRLLKAGFWRESY